MFDRKKLLLYAVTDRRGQPLPQFLVSAEAALRGGVTMLQLREKDLSRSDYISLAFSLAAICRRYGVPLIVNDDYEVALSSGADGVHLGSCDAPVREVRRTAGNNFIIGATAKTVGQALKAQEDGADYLGVGAVFPSPTKPDAVRITPEELKRICSSVSIPAVAIGGINAENALSLSGCSVSGLAVVSAVFSAPDPCAAAREMRRLAGLAAGENAENEKGDPV